MSTRIFEKDILLIGMMGVGKTTVSKIIATQLSYVYVDTDQVLEAKLGKSIKEFFKTEGEDVFRLREKEIFNELAMSQEPFCRVISTGGGLVCEPENRDLLKQAPYVFWLKKDLDIILSSISDHALITNRPMLPRQDLRKRWSQLYKEREEYYRMVVQSEDQIIECNQLDPWDVYLAIANVLGIKN